MKIKKYYYRIRFPKGNYDSLFVQYAPFSSQDDIDLYKNSNKYYISQFSPNIPFEKNYLNEDNIYLNCYEDNAFINLITSNDIFNIYL